MQTKTYSFKQIDVRSLLQVSVDSWLEVVEFMRVNGTFVDDASLLLNVHDWLDSLVLHLDAVVHAMSEG